IFKSLVDVAEDDPLAKNRPVSHKDGWGLLNIYDGGLELKRYGTPLTSRVPTPRVEEGVVIVHVRLAAPSEGKGVLNAHPFHLQDERYDVYISHNGWFDKFEMNKTLGLKSVRNINDTEAFLKLVMSQDGSIEDRIRAALYISKEKRYIKGGANIFLAAIERETKITSVIYYSDVAPEKEYTEYEKLYFLNGMERCYVE
ncbi:MAG: hypothetical protein QW292_07955, partial [Candidatus Parvarchaeota archaeon]